MSDIYPSYTEYKSKIHDELINFKKECILNQIDVPNDLMQKMENCLSEKEYNKLKTKFENYEDDNIDLDINNYRYNPKRKHGISGKWGVFRNYFPMELISKQYDNLNYSDAALYIMGIDALQIKALKYALCIDEYEEQKTEEEIEQHSNKYWQNQQSLTNKEKIKTQQLIEDKKYNLLYYRVRSLWALCKKNDVREISKKLNYIEAHYNKNIENITDKYDALDFISFETITFSQIAMNYEFISLLECSPKFQELFDTYIPFFEQQYKNKTQNGWNNTPYLINIFTHPHRENKKIIYSEEFCKIYWEELSYKEIMGCLSLLTLDRMLYCVKNNDTKGIIQNFQCAVKFIEQIGYIETTDFYKQQINNAKSRIPSLGGKTTAEYWGKEREKLKRIWRTLPDNVRNNNKESIRFLIKHTTLSNRKLEEYIRLWRKEDTQG